MPVLPPTSSHSLRVPFYHVSKKMDTNSKYPFEIQQPHAPRLVGIETNPGPSPLASLFNDGLLSVFAYLSDRDFLSSAAPVSKHWFAVARLSSRKFTHKIHVYKNQKEGIFTSFFSSVKSSPSLSQWSFRDRISALLVYDVAWEDYTACLLQYSQLTSLTIFVTNFGRKQKKNKPVTEKPHLLPFTFTLRTLTIDIRLSRSESLAQFQNLIDHIGSCINLTLLKLTLQSPPNVDHDDQTFTPVGLFSLHQLTLLTHFTFLVERMSPAFMTQLFEVIGSLPGLTHLQCDLGDNQTRVHDVTMSPSLLTLKHISQLANAKQLRSMIMMDRVFTQAEASALHEACPQLHQLQYTSKILHHTFPIALYSRFTQLRELCIQGEPSLVGGIAVSAGSESRVIEEITRMKHLAHIKFVRWCPNQSASWSHLIGSGLKDLTSIAFDTCHIDVNLLVSPELISQLHTLSFHGCRFSTSNGESIFTFLRRFTSLTSLHISVSLQSSVNPVDVMDILEYVNHAFLPRLRLLHISEPNIRNLNLEYDVDKRVSECTFRYQDESEKKEWLTRPLLADSLWRPLSPRLVGIELNPGPETTLSVLLLTASPMNLFGDGIQIILSYLDTSSWFCAARSCRHWCTLADSSKRKLTLRFEKLRDHVAEKEKEKKKKNFWYQLFCRRERNLPRSFTHWYLQSHIDSLQLKTVEWNAFGTLLSKHCVHLSKLTQLEVRSLELPPYVESRLRLKQQQQQEEDCRTLHFPQSLTSLTIRGVSLGLYSHTTMCVDAILTGVGECHHLTRLILPLMSVSHSSVFHRDGFSCLASLTHLQHLELSVCLSSFEQAVGTLTVINSLTSLEHLNLDLRVDHQSNLSNSYLHILQLPHLREYHTNLILFDDELHKMSRNLPALEVLTGMNGSTQDLAIWHQFKHLRQMQFRNRPHLNGNFNPSESEIGRQLSKMNNLTEIAFDEWAPSQPQFWTELTSSMPSKLTSLVFISPLRRDPHDSFRILVSACISESSTTTTTTNFLRIQLTKLTIERRVDNVLPLIDQLQHTIALTELTLVIEQGELPDFDPDGEPIEVHYRIYTRFNSSSFLPHLVRCNCQFNSTIPRPDWYPGSIYKRYMETQMLILYDRDTGENRVEFIEQSQDQRRLHRAPTSTPR